MKNKRHFVGEGFLLLATLLWAGTFSLIKEGLEYSSPSIFVGTRFGLAALIILPFIYKVLKNQNKTAYIHGIILALLFFLGFQLQTIGLKFTTVSKSAFITGTFVVFTPIFQMLIERKMPKKGNIIGIILVFIGIVFLSSKGTSFTDVFIELGESFNIGDVFTLLCAIDYGLYVVFVDMYSRKHDFRYLTFIQLSIASGLAFLSALLLDITSFEIARMEITTTFIFAILYCTIFASIFATMLHTKYQKEVTPTKAGIIFSMEPIFATIIAVVFLSESVSMFGVIGSAFIFAGLLVSELINDK